MNKSVLSIGIVLSLGTMGCAGVGLHHASSLIPQFQRERGLDSLWVSTERAPTQALDIPLYAEDNLGDLWNSKEEAPTAARETPFYEGRSLGDLWNRSSVTPNSKTDSSRRLRADRSQSAAR
ncbi:MAG: hypothetical protein OEV36_01390 [Myxococcales bacterium]|nr:hypothetical protein [Myxococcales bacterium]